MILVAGGSLLPGYLDACAVHDSMTRELTLVRVLNLQAVQDGQVLGDYGHLD